MLRHFHGSVSYTHLRTKEIAILFKNILKDGLGMMPRFTVFFILLIYAVIIAHYFYKHRMLKEALWVCCAVGAIFLCCFSLSYLPVSYTHLAI